ncbi:MAG: DNA polymerase III subunit gamma/tau, partial [Candidatus Omnitrophica bacterium]|nr:DNA polymerase III subunit gamma/tau [Candidatus Omnitrophota bacterium]
MSYVVFARKYRPKDFDEIVGQPHITTTLKNAIKQNRVAHAYLFSGPRGIGKTTTARILAKALNCQKGPTQNPCSKCVSCNEISSGISMDVIEIDGASNRGIDEVRELRENVKFAPTHGCYKLYIIDEVHMLTQEAFNALLKTLEEPPPHVKFIFATTQAQKVPATVSSRCQRFDFRRISTADTVSKLKEIAKDESVSADDETLFLIARQADGSLRDAESIFDQLNTFCRGKIKRDDVAKILGAVGDDLLEQFAAIIAKRDAPSALKLTDRLVNEGKDLSLFLSSLIGHFRNLMVTKLCSKPEGLIDTSKETIERLRDQSKNFSQEELFYISDVLTHTHESIKRSASARVIFELAVVKIANRQSLLPLNEILEKLQEMEQRIKKGMPNTVIASEAKQSHKEIASSPNIASQTPRNDGEGEFETPRPAKRDPAERSLHTARRDNDKDTASPDAVELSTIQEAWPLLL